MLEVRAIAFLFDNYKIRNNYLKAQILIRIKRNVLLYQEMFFKLWMFVSRLGVELLVGVAGYFAAGIIMGENLAVGITALCHHGGPYLA